MEKAIDIDVLMDLLLKDDVNFKKSSIQVYSQLKKINEVNKTAVSDNTLKAVDNCSNIVKYAINIPRQKKKALYMETCKNRFCPMCTKRKAIKNGEKIYTLSNYLQNQNYKFIFVTLTVRNVKGKDLSNEIKKINLGIKNLFKKKGFDKKVLPGYITKIEITYNEIAKTYHPHAHLLIAVKRSYFKGTKYLSRAKWLKAWQDVMKDKTITQVHVQRVKDFEKSILEISKYQAKSKDFLSNDEVFQTYFYAIKGTQSLRFNRIYQQLARAYDLDKYGIFDQFRPEREFIQFQYKLIGVWTYKNKNYHYQSRIKNLTKQEKKIANGPIEIKKYNDFKTEEYILLEKIKTEIANIDSMKEQLSSIDTTSVQNTNVKNKGLTEEHVIKDMISSTKRKLSPLMAKYHTFQFMDKTLQKYFTK